MTTQRQLDAILRELEPELRQALMEAFDGIRNDIDMTDLRNAVERGDLGGLLDNIESYFSTYAMVASNIFVRYGTSFAPTIEYVDDDEFLTNDSNRQQRRAERALERRRERRARRARARFNAINAMPALQSVIAENVARMTEETRQMARELIISGVGQRETARRIRESIGLSVPQAGYVENMRRRLESNDPAELRAILKGQTLRDKRFDATIKKAIRTGGAIPPAQIQKMTDAYTRKLRRKRAEDVARAEAQQYAETAKFEAAKQAGGVVTKEWRHSRIWLRARPDHVMMNGVKVVGLETPFVMPDGVAMQHAHDPVGGAKHNASCRCQTRYRRIRDG